MVSIDFSEFTKARHQSLGLQPEPIPRYPAFSHRPYAPMVNTVSDPFADNFYWNSNVELRITFERILTREWQAYNTRQIYFNKLFRQFSSSLHLISNIISTTTQQLKERGQFTLRGSLLGKFGVMISEDPGESLLLRSSVHHMINRQCRGERRVSVTQSVSPLTANWNDEIEGNETSWFSGSTKYQYMVGR